MFGCTECRVGEDRCPRCTTRLCIEHMPLPGEACAECELAYHESRESLHMNLWFLLGFALPWLAYAALWTQLPSWSARSGGPRAITTGFPALDVLIMFAITAYFTGKAMMGVRAQLHRRAFMRRPLPRATLNT